MGDYFQRIVDVEVGVEEAGPLAERMVEWMVGDGGDHAGVVGRRGVQPEHR